MTAQYMLNSTNHMTFKHNFFYLLNSKASAFAPVSKRVPATSSLKMSDFKNEIGVQAPLGLWDPLGLLKGKQASIRRLFVITTFPINFF